MRITPTESLLSALREFRQRRGWSDDVTSAHDAFMLYGGMGPAMYLTSDGRFLIDGLAWDDTPLRESSDDEAICSLVVGAKRTGIAELLAFVPPAPASANICNVCGGTRWQVLRGTVPELPPVICTTCWGRGWVS